MPTFSVQENPPIDFEEMSQKINILWKERATKQVAPPRLHFPEHVEEVTPKEVLDIVIAIQKCYRYDIPEACPGLLRKALFSAIKIKFYMKEQKDELYDTEGNRKSNWIDITKKKGYLSQELAKQLKRVKVFGDIGVHDEKIKFDKAEVADAFSLLRYIIEHMYKTA